MSDHHCRVCDQFLTIDNIYPSDLKYKNWICKSCSGQAKRDRELKNKQPIAPPQYNPDDVSFKRSTANYMRGAVVNNDNVKSLGSCAICKAYNSPTGTCRLNPPMVNSFPKVSPNDYCLHFTYVI
jgi:hypothetical protein